jgi:hypothetical protein
MDPAPGQPMEQQECQEGGSPAPFAQQGDVQLLKVSQAISLAMLISGQAGIVTEAIGLVLNGGNKTEQTLCQESTYLNKTWQIHPYAIEQLSNGKQGAGKCCSTN